jgi:CheY-like chemotaxis protein
VNKRALVIDDDESYRRAVERVLKRLGCEVDTANNFVNGKTLLYANAYALIVCDNSMPINDRTEPRSNCGLDLLECAKLAGPNADTPFVLHTGDDSGKTMQKVKNLGGFYCRKPSKGLNTFLEKLLPKA